MEENMKITKNAFCEKLANNTSIFAGNTKRLYERDETYCALKEVINGVRDKKLFVEMRECVVKPTFIEFTGGSRLYLNQQGNYNFYRYDFPYGDVYICQHTSTSEAYGVIENVCYYIIMH